MESPDVYKPGRFYYIEVEVNPVVVIKDIEHKQRIGGYPTQATVTRDFKRVVSYIAETYFPECVTMRKESDDDNVLDSVEIKSPDTWMSRIQISCIDHRGATKH